MPMSCTRCHCRRSLHQQLNQNSRTAGGHTRQAGAGAAGGVLAADLDGAFGGSGAEIINHSCDPNLRTWNFKGHILYMSKRVIRPGEELTVDYRFSDKIDKVKCRCGSPNCRGVINLSE